MNNRIKKFLLTLACSSLITSVFSQTGLTLDMSAIDGLDITPDNILNFTIFSNELHSLDVMIKGEVRFRNTTDYMRYSIRCKVENGLNRIDTRMASPVWEFSGSAIRELFQQYKVLPEGTYRYCINVTPLLNNENGIPLADDCILHRSQPLFLINLVSPEDKSVIKNYYPTLTWMTTSSLVGMLDYRVRVAEMKHGQTPTNAVLRNPPIYEERNVLENSRIYPVYARPLQKDQPYAWTVDAYYKGLLIGSAESWQFIIKEDTNNTKAVDSRSYIDISREGGQTLQYAIGILKLKYVLQYKKSDELQLTLYDSEGEQVNWKQVSLKATYGDNRYDLDLSATANLKHKKEYEVRITNQKGNSFRVPFLYLNPDFQ